jgi:CBS domain-containing protein
MSSLEEIAATSINDVPHREPVRVPADMKLLDVVTKLREHHRGAVVIEDDSGVIGIFTEGDLRLGIDHADQSWHSTPVGDVMTKTPTTIRTDQTIHDALNTMLVGTFRHLPMVDPDGKPAGIVSIRDILAHLVEFFPQEFVNLPPDPEHEAKAPWGG